MTDRDEATRAQVRAARPDASTWLAANAGSGKTRVLTDRVARLLLDGVQPQHILCLTYTKAAASEMQNRLFRRLGAWAMLGDDLLRTSLVDLGVDGPIGSDRLKDARTLFARAIETPGGLKIQTIHSFCSSLLRRFPLEAQVSPQFTEIEDRAADLLRGEIVEEMADGKDAGLIEDLARHYNGEDFSKLTRAIVSHRDIFPGTGSVESISSAFGLHPKTDGSTILENVFSRDLSEWLPATCDILRTQSKTMVLLADALSGLDLKSPGTQDLVTLKNLFLYRSGKTWLPTAKTGSVPTKKAREALGDLALHLDDFMQRVADAHDTGLALAAREKSLALHQFSVRFLALYENRKLLRGWLDFDDLIFKARALLTDAKVAAWVLYRIDGGIDHILVDEAQDTSPAQWDVIRNLATEFYSGQGAREDTLRTLFVVGDKKQSIYSFQGADPREFDRMAIEFREKFEAAEQIFQRETLGWSFRSSGAVLQLVDQVFREHSEAGFGEGSEHFAFKAALPGRVDLWPLVEEKDRPDDGPWYDPLDRLSEQHHDVILADQIAGRIKDMLTSGTTIPSDGAGPGKFERRALKPGDFLILVQRRASLFSEIIRACKSLDLPIAGADRLKVGGELAVRDLAALLSFLATPEDSLSLAAALRSPLFGWSEQELFTLAHGRENQNLWQVLRHRENDHPETLHILYDLRANVDFLRPFDLVERILTRHGGRRRLLARLGTEAEDGINALLSQALAYERTSIPSLTGFLVWMQTDDLEIKRQIDSASDQIRVMTVHGAKGLEAPVVILPDTGKRDIRINDEILKVGNVPVWKPATPEMPRSVASAVDTMKDAQAEERLRLLYVALTRAEKWLIVAAAGKLSKNGDSWYQMVDAALDDAGAQEADFFGMPVKRLSRGDWNALPLRAAPSDVKEKPQLPAYLTSPATAPVTPREIVSPSGLGGAKALPGEAGRSEDAAKAYGIRVHYFLEHLASVPEQDRTRLAQSMQTADPEDFAALKEAQAVLNTPDLQHLFHPSSLAEVPVSADFGSARMSGVIDRLIVTDGVVLAVDFKTNQVVPESADACPEGLLRQMGAYAHGLGQIYPDHEIRTAILWTSVCHLMPLPHEIVSIATQNTPYLDGRPTGT